MTFHDRLREQGWNLSPEGIQQVSENGLLTDMKRIARNALDTDIRDISCGSFPEDIGKGKLDCIPGKIVVQVQKVRNVSAPKANEESRHAPRMLKLTLTDGITVCQALELENIQDLSVNTPPGTKLFLKGDSIAMVHGILLLKVSQVQVLGGKVAAMMDKWELNRSLAKHSRGRLEEGGPPPWIPFGQKVLRINPQDRHFKSLESSKDSENRENDEFETQRKDAIAEAARIGGMKKVFGGGYKPLLDHNVQQIVDYGFTVDQAENALRLSRNNPVGALRHLQNVAPKDREATNPPRTERRRQRVDRDRKTDEDGGVAPKPSARVSLFDFLEDKLPVQIEREAIESPGARGGYSNNPRPSQRGGRGNYGDKCARQNQSSLSMYQQKPPRFQNQHRNPHQEVQPAWSSCVNDSNNWNPRNTSTRPGRYSAEEPRQHLRRDTAVELGFQGGAYGSLPIGTKCQSNQYASDSKSWVWHKGDKCMAKYWEDNMYYNAEVTGVSHRTCVVRFLEYGNHEEVLQDDCIPFTEVS